MDNKRHGTRHGSPEFYSLLERMANVHDAKSHDYASNDNPFGNYHFAGMLSKLFNNSDDAGFVGRIGEKIYRLANLENSGKTAKNETIEDTEIDICVIVTLWMADRLKRRHESQLSTGGTVIKDIRYKCSKCGMGFNHIPYYSSNLPGGMYCSELCYNAAND